MHKSYEIKYDGKKIRLKLTVDRNTVAKMITIKPGDSLMVKPDNPQKMKHRDRTCRINSFRFDDIGNPIQANVTFLDTNRAGRVDLEDLAAL